MSISSSHDRRIVSGTQSHNAQSWQVETYNEKFLVVIDKPSDAKTLEADRAAFEDKANALRKQGFRVNVGIDLETKKVNGKNTPAVKVRLEVNVDTLEKSSRSAATVLRELGFTIQTGMLPAAAKIHQAGISLRAQAQAAAEAGDTTRVPSQQEVTRGYEILGGERPMHPNRGQLESLKSDILLVQQRLNRIAGRQILAENGICDRTTYMIWQNFRYDKYPDKFADAVENAPGELLRVLRAEAEAFPSLEMSKSKLLSDDEHLKTLGTPTTQPAPQGPAANDGPTVRVIDTP